MDQLPFNASVVAITGGTIVGVVISGSTVLASTLSGNTLVNSTISGGTAVNMSLSGVAIVGSTSTFSGSTITSTGVISTTATTASTTTSTGALIVGNGTSGGLGVGGKINSTTAKAFITSTAYSESAALSGISASFVVGDAAATFRGMGFTTAGSRRWMWYTLNGAESGSNAGSDLQLWAYDDSNAAIDQPISLIRAASGAITLARPISATNTTEASAVGTASIIGAGGLGIAKRSYLGTIGGTFKGNVLAGVQDATATVAGQVGERISSTVSGVAVAGSGTVGNVTSISLTAGDWDIAAFAVLTGGATGLTNTTAVKLSIVTTTATNGTSGSTMAQESVLALLANGLFTLSIPNVTANISATTTYYLTEEVSFAAGSPTVAATIIATRVR